MPPIAPPPSGGSPANPSATSISEDPYARQAMHPDKDLTDETRIAITKSWFRKDTADYWRHARMYEAVECFASEPASTWLTVGDGRFGLDSIRIREKGFRDVTPTDISEALLRKSREEGWIETYGVENAESLGFGDGAFDYVFCKESYHHFPQPMLALYQMLRVARNAVVLIEPNDTQGSLLRRVKWALMSAVHGGSHPDSSKYEESGNYVYSVSRRELEKVALGVNLPLIATKGLTDHFIEGCEFEPASWRSAIYRKIRLKCALQSLLACTGLHVYPLLMAVIFKTEPASEVLSRFETLRWEVTRLPRNPHLR